jgi:hypothetical protein
MRENAYYMLGFMNFEPLCTYYISLTFIPCLCVRDCHHDLDRYIAECSNYSEVCGLSLKEIISRVRINLKKSCNSILKII